MCLPGPNTITGLQARPCVLGRKISVPGKMNTEPRERHVCGIFANLSLVFVTDF